MTADENSDEDVEIKQSLFISAALEHTESPMDYLVVLCCEL